MEDYKVTPMEACYGAYIREQQEALDWLKCQVKYMRAALKHIARTCIADPDIAQFALRASENPPTAFAPAEDYEE